MAAPKRDIVKQLDDSMPAASNAALGTTIEELQQNLNALLAKLDADVGVTDTNYASTLAVTPLSQKG
ncbi:MAG: hypothetical protein ACU843_15175 [Gammaproteobacteria bacterium]